MKLAYVKIICSELSLSCGLKNTSHSVSKYHPFWAVDDHQKDAYPKQHSKSAQNPYKHCIAKVEPTLKQFGMPSGIRCHNFFTLICIKMDVFWLNPEDLCNYWNFYIIFCYMSKTIYKIFRVNHMQGRYDKLLYKERMLEIFAETEVPSNSFEFIPNYLVIFISKSTSKKKEHQHISVYCKTTLK